jgi:cell wall assembly regulator SMI1
MSTPPTDRELIERLDRWLAAHRPGYYSRLQPGVSDADLDAFETQFAFVRWKKSPAPRKCWTT